MAKVRKFANKFVEDNLENMLLDGEAQGYNFIELRLNEFGPNEEMIVGPEELKIQRYRVAGQQFATESKARIIKDGVVRFFPDDNFRLWGYVLDTPKNRLWLATTIATGKVIIVETSVKNEVIKLAMEKGISTDKVRVDKSLDGYITSKNVEVENENEKLQKELAELRAENKELKEAKPLAGKKTTATRKPAANKTAIKS